MPANSIHPNNPRVFVCRVGHVSKEAHGYAKYSCCKLITVDGVERQCRKKAVMMEEAFARNLYRRGWNKHLDRQIMLHRRIFDVVMIETREIMRALKA